MDPDHNKIIRKYRQRTGSLLLYESVHCFVFLRKLKHSLPFKLCDELFQLCFFVSEVDFFYLITCYHSNCLLFVFSFPSTLLFIFFILMIQPGELNVHLSHAPNASHHTTGPWMPKITPPTSLLRVRRRALSMAGCMYS